MSNLTTLGALLALPGLRPDLKGPRTRGSLTDAGLESLDPSTPVVEFTPEDAALTVPGARYFRVETPTLNGRLGAVRYGTLTRDQLALFRTRNDINPSIPVEKAREHGVEFYLDVDPDAADLPPVDFSTVILGPLDAEGTLGWWTWHPGEVMGTAMARGKPTNCPLGLVGVKLHNGTN